uniref:Cadherin domain-containing protein n=1 Tax=Timema monikensis TaxID=170555 RepID=A0A7R9EA48_9NEOP|nr:unnamed protein product [Timema monikensis]
MVLSDLLGMWRLAFESRYDCDNAPPILKVPERTWELTDTELVDSIVTRVKADDDEDDPLVFGLEMKPALPGFPENLPLPLRIDNITGVVYINDSLKGRAGESFSVYVTVTDGNIHAKTEVPVSIRGSGVSNGPYQKSSRPPRPGVASNYPPRGPPLFRPPGLNLSPPPPRPPRPTTDSTLLSVVTPTVSRVLSLTGDSLRSLNQAESLGNWES